MKKQFDFLFVDFMVEDTHRTYCNSLIDALNREHSSLVVEKENYINYESDDKHRIVTIKAKEIVGNYPFKARYNTFYNYKNTLEELNGYSFKKIVVLGYDPVMFFLMYKKLLSMGDVYLVAHHQLDEVFQNRWKMKIWNTYKHKVNHIVLDEAIVELMVDTFDIAKSKIHVFPHPCIFVPNYLKVNVTKTKILCISNSNDAKQVFDLIEYEKNTGVFEKNNIEFIVRKKDGIGNLKINSIKVIDGYLSDDEYNKLNAECDIVFMPFPLDYKFRCSGTLIDALAAGKKVISSEVLEAKAYEQLFPEMCKTYSDVKNICDIINDFQANNLDEVKRRFFEYQKETKLKGIRSIGE